MRRSPRRENRRRSYCNEKLASLKGAWESCVDEQRRRDRAAAASRPAYPPGGPRPRSRSSSALPDAAPRDAPKTDRARSPRPSTHALETASSSSRRRRKSTTDLPAAADEPRRPSRGRPPRACAGPARRPPAPPAADPAGNARAGAPPSGRRDHRPPPAKASSPRAAAPTPGSPYAKSVRGRKSPKSPGAPRSALRPRPPGGDKPRRPASAGAARPPAKKATGVNLRQGVKYVGRWLRRRKPPAPDATPRTSASLSPRKPRPDEPAPPDPKSFTDDLGATTKFLTKHSNRPCCFEVQTARRPRSPATAPRPKPPHRAQAAGSDDRNYYDTATATWSRAPPAGAPRWYCMTNDDAVAYYWHSLTGDTAWDHPGEDVWRECAAPDLPGRKVYSWAGPAAASG